MKTTPKHEETSEKKEQQSGLPTFSIVIPARNEEFEDKHNVSALLQLILNENLPCEVFVVDNGSDPKDQTKEVVEKLSKSSGQVKIHYLKSEPGVSKARNLGAAHSKAEYIFFIDADSRFNPGFFSRALQEASQKNIDIAQFNLVPDIASLTNRAILKITNISQKLSIKTDTPFCTGVTILVRKNKHLPFDENITFGEDSVYIQEVVRRGAKPGIIDDEDIIVNMERANHDPVGFIRKHLKNTFSILLFHHPSNELVNEYQKDRRGRKY